jgi:lauroyl/myristoyl acyltransferase
MTPKAQPIRTSQAGPPEPAFRHFPDHSPGVADSQAPPQSKPGARLPLVTPKDLCWFAYLYPGRWAARISRGLLRLLLGIADPIFRCISRPAQREMAKGLATAFGGQMPLQERHRIVHRYVSNAIRRAGDDLLMGEGRERVNCRSFDGREHLDTALASGKGVLLISMHWYASRIARRYMALLGYPVMAVRNRYPPDMRMGYLGRKLLKPKYVELLHKVIQDEVFIQDPECSLKILGRLRANGIVDIHYDSHFSKQMLERSFLGHAESFPAGPLHLARISGCAVLPMLAVGHAGSLEIQIGRPFILDRNLPGEEYCRKYMPVLAQAMEAHVRRYPDQWELWTRL